MHLVDDINPVPSFCGRILDLVTDIADILHAVVGCSINFHHVHG